jgi:prepilin-type N-terminal cleavage/methylation domain-containing protein
MTSPLGHQERGFSLIDVMAVITIIGILLAMAVPTMIASVDNARLGQATREVEREIHMAKSRAVTKGRPTRIRFNCPAAGQYRITELIGTPTVPAAADSAANRCDELAYPFPAADNDPSTLPNLDGPVRHLDSKVSFSATQTIEFWPDGTAHHTGGIVGSPWPLIPTTGITISLERNGRTGAITVNGLGKISVAFSN